MLFPLPGEPAEIAAENAPPGTGIGDRHFLPALAAPEDLAYLLPGDIPGVLPVKPFTVGGTEFLPPVIQTGHLHKLSAAGAGEDPEDGSLSHFVRRAARLFPVSPAAARFGAEALRSPVRGEGPAAAGAYGLYVHRMPRSAGKKTRKKGRVKSSLCMINPGSIEVPRYAVTVKDAAAGVKSCSLPPPRLRVMRGICFAARPASLRTELMTFTSFCSNGFIISTPCRCVNGHKII